MVESFHDDEHERNVAMKNTNRTADGRYTHGRLDKPCLCGHVLGEHSAERVRLGSKDAAHFGCKVMQDCFEEGCECLCFTLDRKAWMG